MATAAEIVELDVDELEVRLNESRRELFNLRFQLATGQLDNFSRMRHVRKDIARLLTEIRAREIAEAEGLAMEDIPVHQAAARQRAEDKALGRTRVPAAERRAAERAEESDAEEAEGDGGRGRGPGRRSRGRGGRSRGRGRRRPRSHGRHGGTHRTAGAADDDVEEEG